MGSYRLRDADRSVKLAVALFLTALGCAYIFAFLMVKTYAGLTPADLAATYAPSGPVSSAAVPSATSSQTETVDLSTLGDEAHTVDTDLLIQDSHVHILLYAIVAALEALVIFGLGWPQWWRDTVIVVAFTSGLFDFAGQWLIKAGLPAFSWLTLAGGWAMAAVYLVVAAGAFRELVARPTPQM
jgi:hypothetical protein